MFRTTLPAGNHVISQVQYHAPSTQTLLALCCGLMAYMTMADTRLYKPEVGDYYIVTDHGTASLVKKAVFDGATKSMGPTIKHPPQYRVPDTLYSISAVDMGAGDDITRLFLFDPQEFSLAQEKVKANPAYIDGGKKITVTVGGFDKSKSDTLGMREENGYADKVKPATGNTFATMSDVTKDAITAMGKVNDAAAQANAEYDAAYKNRAKNPTEVAAQANDQFDIKLLNSTDAKLWAAEFCKSNKTADPAALYGWFATAIRAGYNEAMRDADKVRKVKYDSNQNIIKSLTAQNEKKQTQINDHQIVVAKYQAMHKTVQERNATQSNLIYHMRKLAEQQVALANGD